MLEVNTKPRFVLIDPSAIHMGGHHYEYAARILRVAKSQGYDAELWAHKTSNLPEDEFPVYSVFRNTFYDNFRPLTKAKFLKGAPGAALRRHIMRLRSKIISKTMVFFLGKPIALNVARAFHDYNVQGAYRPIYHAPQNHVKASSFLYTACFMAFAFWRLVIKMVHRRPVRILIKLAVLLALLLMLPLIVTVLGLAALYVFVQLQRKPADKLFAEDMERAMRSRGPWTPQDILFIPTCFSTEIKGLGAFLVASNNTMPQFHILFRTNVFQGHIDTFRQQLENHLDYRLAFKWLRQKMPLAPVHYYTDTRQLSEQYKILSDEDFGVLPVPVPWMPSAEQPAQAGPVKIVYVGDVRDEKGYQHYPYIVENLWDDFIVNGKVQFVLQSNFADNPLACVDCFGAQRLMRGYREEAVRHVAGPLNSEGYKNLIEEADVILLNYRPEPYMARSSGIFIEAMKAGKPVLMPSCTWMTSLVDAQRQARWRESLAQAKISHETAHGEWLAGAPLTLASSGKTKLIGAEFTAADLNAPRGVYVELTAHIGDHEHSVVVEMDEGRKAVAMLAVNAAAGEEIMLRYRFLGGAAGVAAKIYLSEEGWQGPLDYAAAIYAKQEPQMMADRLRELILNIEGYKAQARDFAARHGESFTPDHLVAELLQRRAA